ncbi:Leucine-rich repeat-containing protein 14B [Manis javanica]|nr:Leucine-rich repeat-containing protein 14B [Manis javanica]
MPAPTAPVAPVQPEPATAPDAAQQAEATSFRHGSDFARKALDAGISEKTVRSALEPAGCNAARCSWTARNPNSRARPGSTWTAPYRPHCQGRAKLRGSCTAQSASQRYGVPAEVIAAIWGMESNFGAATSATSPRSMRWPRWPSTAGAPPGRKELLAALRIDNGDIDAAHMIGSWAGAMGHTQFMPSVFLAYAVDADGDGRRDIWGSLPDVTASTANYLAHSGWKTGEPWGVEVRLPAGFDHARAEAPACAGTARNGDQACRPWTAPPALHGRCQRDRAGRRARARPSW